jgi:hypothetical protein
MPWLLHGRRRSEHQENCPDNGPRKCLNAPFGKPFNATPNRVAKAAVPTHRLVVKATERSQDRRAGANKKLQLLSEIIDVMWRGP